MKKITRKSCKKIISFFQTIIYTQASFCMPCLPVQNEFKAVAAVRGGVG